MKFRSIFMVWGAFVLVVVLSLSLTAESYYIHERQATSHPVCHREFGRTVRGSGFRHASSLFELGTFHLRRSPLPFYPEGHPDGQVGFRGTYRHEHPHDCHQQDDKKNGDDHPDRINGDFRLGYLGRHALHSPLDGPGKFMRRDNADGVKKADQLDHSFHPGNFRSLETFDGPDDLKRPLRAEPQPFVQWKSDRSNQFYDRESSTEIEKLDHSRVVSDEGKFEHSTLYQDLDNSDGHKDPDEHENMKSMGRFVHVEEDDRNEEVDRRDHSVRHDVPRKSAEHDHSEDATMSGRLHCGGRKYGKHIHPERLDNMRRVDTFDNTEPNDISERPARFRYNVGKDYLPEGLRHMRNPHQLGKIQSGFKRAYFHGQKSHFLSSFREYLHRALDEMWAKKKGSPGYEHCVTNVARKQLLKATPWPEAFTVNFTTNMRAATGFVAYDWTQKRQVILHGPNSTYCAGFGTDDSCQMLRILGKGSFVYIPSQEKCARVEEKVKSLPPKWTTFSVYTGTEEMPGVGQCNAFAFPPTKHVYYETVNGNLPCAFEFADSSLTYNFMPKTFRLGTPDAKIFDFPQYCFTAGNDDISSSAEHGDETLRTEAKMEGGLKSAE